MEAWGFELNPAADWLTKPGMRHSQCSGIGCNVLNFNFKLRTQANKCQTKGHKYAAAESSRL
jgi:hypothetical protein